MSELSLVKKGGGGSKCQTVVVTVSGVSPSITFTGLSKQYDSYAVFSVNLYVHPQYTAAINCTLENGIYTVRCYWVNSNGLITLAAKQVTPAITKNSFSVDGGWGSPFYGTYRLVAWDD